MNNSSSKLKHYKGLSLVELLVAVTLSIIASSIAISIYLNIKDFYTSSTEKADTNVKELTVKQAIYDSIVNSGLSCPFGTSYQTYTNNTGDDLSGDAFLTDSSNIRIGPISPSVSNSLETNLGSNCLGTCYQANTDYIMIRREVSSTELSTNNINSTLTLDSTSDINNGDYLALCNSSQIDLVKVTNVNSNNVTLTNPPSSQYITGDYAGKFEILLFYIGDSGRINADGSHIYSLFLYIKSGSSASQSYELVSDVEDLNVYYSSVENNNLTWNHITTDTDIDDLTTDALKFTFVIKGETFSRIVILS